MIGVFAILSENETPPANLDEQKQIPLGERIKQLKDQKPGLSVKEATEILTNEGYNDREIQKYAQIFQPTQSDINGKEAAKKFQEDFEERIKVLKEEGKTNKEICLILEHEGVNPQLIITQFGGAYTAAKRDERKQAEASQESAEDRVQLDLQGRGGKDGWLVEIQTMIAAQVQKSRELTTFCFNQGLAVLLASLYKTGMTMDDFRKIALTQTGLAEALQKAAEIPYKALDAFESDRYALLENERDGARMYASTLEVSRDELMKNLDPKIRLERMIISYLLSGNVDPNVLTPLIDKWLSLELEEIKMAVRT